MCRKYIKYKPILFLGLWEFDSLLYLEHFFSFIVPRNSKEFPFASIKPKKNHKISNVFNTISEETKISYLLVLHWYFHNWLKIHFLNIQELYYDHFLYAITCYSMQKPILDSESLKVLQYTKLYWLVYLEENFRSFSFISYAKNLKTCIY